MTEKKKPQKGVRYGGRQKGTTNKVTAATKEVISNLLGEYQASGRMSEDFDALEPKDRIGVAERLMQYVMPKMQATAVDFNGASTKITIEQQLKELSQEQD